MVPSCSHPPRERLLAEAARLFATQGYAATSIADIQLAAGMTAGSGALYKHFASKQALLGEVVGLHVATMRQSRRSFADTAPTEPEAALRHLLGGVWAAMRQDHQVVRVMLRDLDAFPELLDRIWNEIRTNVYDEFAAWLTAQKTRGIVELPDPEATAAVLLASLTYYPILDILIGHTPADLTADRFTEAWVSAAMATLTPEPIDDPWPGATAISWLRGTVVLPKLHREPVQRQLGESGYVNRMREQ